MKIRDKTVFIAKVYIKTSALSNKIIEIANNRNYKQTSMFVNNIV